MALSSAPGIERAQVACYRIPTETPESDGTLAWDATTLVLVTIEADGVAGIGYTYADTATGCLIRDHLLPLLLRGSALDITRHAQTLRDSLRNLGALGIGAMALSAIDIALWDLKAKLLGIALIDLLGAARADIPVYGSGGFTSYSQAQLCAQLKGWAQSGMGRVKMKIGREPATDPARIRAARTAVGDRVELFVDANGAYSRKQALAMAHICADARVGWFEEPVRADDLDGLRLLRDRAPPPIAISAGEYGYEPPYFQRLLQARAVDVLQADASRCGGFSGFMNVAALCAAFRVPLSSHCAPALHTALGCALTPVCHLEYFHDHARIEQSLFEGAAIAQRGQVCPDRSRPGLGLVFKEADARAFAV